MWGRKKSERAALSVYRRPDAYYVVAYGATSTGMWSYSGAAATILDLGSTAQELGEVVNEVLSLSPVSMRHPADQGEWTADTRQALTPLQKQAGVRSWRAFLSPARTVGVHRDGATVRVTPWVPDPKRRDAQVPVVEHVVTLTAPDSETLGTAIQTALTHAPSYS